MRNWLRWKNQICGAKISGWDVKARNLFTLGKLPAKRKLVHKDEMEGAGGGQSAFIVLMRVDTGILSNFFHAVFKRTDTLT